MIVEHKMNWLFFLNNKGEGENTGEPTPLEEALGEELPEEIKPEEGKEEKTDDEKATEAKAEKDKQDKEEAENLIDVEGYKGKNRRATAFSGEEKRKDAIEKRDTLDLGFEYGSGDKKGQKITLEEIKTTMKWLQDNNETIMGGISMNKYAADYPQFGKILTAIIHGSFGEDNKFNEAFTTKILAAVEAKEEQVEEQADEVDAEIAKIQKLLDDEEVDPESVHGQSLKSSLISLKSMKKQLADNKKQLVEVNKRFDTQDDDKTKAAEAQKTDDYEKEKARYGKIFKDQIDLLIDPKDEKAYKFLVEAESKEFDGIVRAGVSKAILDKGLKAGEKFPEDDLKKLVVEHAKLAYDVITKKREAITQAYIKSKGGKLPVKKDEKEIPEAKEGEDMNVGDLAEVIEKELPSAAG